MDYLNILTIRYGCFITIIIIFSNAHVKMFNCIINNSMFNFMYVNRYIILKYHTRFWLILSGMCKLIYHIHLLDIEGVNNYFCVTIKMQNVKFK